jgi:hypothetical protein
VTTISSTVAGEVTLSPRTVETAVRFWKVDVRSLAISAEEVAFVAVISATT